MSTGVDVVVLCCGLGEKLCSLLLLLIRDYQSGINIICCDSLNYYIKMPPGKSIDPVVDLKTHPMKSWESIKALYPSLYPMAKKYLAAVATSVPAERLFSKAGFVVNLRRNRSVAKRPSKILFLNCLKA